MNRYVDMALNLAREHKWDENLLSCHCALIISGGRVLSVGFNSMASSGLQRRYATNPFCHNVHAEISSILEIRRKICLTGSKMVVVRRLRADSVLVPSIGMSRPCEMCTAVLFSYGIKKVIYTISNNEIGFMRVTDPRNP